MFFLFLESKPYHGLSLVVSPLQKHQSCLTITLLSLTVAPYLGAFFFCLPLLATRK